MTHDVPVWDGLVAVLRETFDDSSVPITRETTAADIPEWDSLSNVEFMVGLEQRFNVRFSVSEIATLRNVGELADVIAARMQRGR
jgi:acyl carrier protein